MKERKILGLKLDFTLIISDDVNNIFWQKMGLKDDLTGDLKKKMNRIFFFHLQNWGFLIGGVCFN